MGGLGNVTGRSCQWLPALALALPTAHSQAVPLLAFNSSTANKEEGSLQKCRFEATCCDFPWGPGESPRMWEPAEEGAVEGAGSQPERSRASVRGHKQ